MAARKKVLSDQTPEQRALDRQKAEIEARGSNRSCGGCNACCTIQAVGAPIFEGGRKPGFCDCPHQTQGAGCGIYETRPRPCQAYRCQWLMGLLDEGDRPDKIGLVLTAWPASGKIEELGQRLYGVQVFELWPGAAESGRGAEVVEGIRRLNHAAIIIRPRDRTIKVPLTLSGGVSWVSFAKDTVINVQESEE